jgi:hypothetical protein
MMLLRRMLRCLYHLGLSPFCDRSNKNLAYLFSGGIDPSQSIWWLTVEHPSGSVVTRAISRRGLLEPDNRLNVVKNLGNPGCAICSIWRETQMDITTLLIIVVLIVLLGGGGWYGRGRWY